MPDARSEWNFFFFDMHFNPKFKNKELPIDKKFINSIYVKLNNTSNGKSKIFCFRKSIEFCLMKCWIFDF
jgi:hypothetical protein